MTPRDGRQKLTDAQCEEIRRLRWKHWSITDLAKWFQVTPNHITRILAGVRRPEVLHDQG